MLEIQLFDQMIEIHQQFKLQNKDKFKIALASFDILNENYKMQNGFYYLNPSQVIELWSKLWEI